MKTTVFITMMAAGLALTACNNDNEPAPSEVAAVITTNLGNHIQTRMADAQWAPDDAIGIFSLSDEMADVTIDGIAQSNMAVNLKYTRTTAGGWDGGVTAFRFKNPKAPTVDFKAYYPHTESNLISDGTIGEIDGTISVDATDQSADGQTKFDFLYADKDKDSNTPSGNKDNPNIRFQFTHSMSKVVIVLQPDGTSVRELGEMKPLLRGLKANGTFSLENGVVAVSGDAVNLSLKNQIEANTLNKQSFVAIVPPQTASDDVYLTIESGSDTYLSAKILKSQELLAGHCYTVTITVKKVELVVESSEITDWDPADGGKGDAILQ